VPSNLESHAPPFGALTAAMETTAESAPDPDGETVRGGAVASLNCVGEPTMPIPLPASLAAILARLAALSCRSETRLAIA
jgi:hypothetical protein